MKKTPKNPDVKGWEKIWEVADAPILEMGQGTLFSLKQQHKIFGYTTKGMMLYGEKEFLTAYYSQKDLAEAGPWSLEAKLSNDSK